MNKLVLVVSLMILTICASYAQVYKWTDSQGNVHFSDIPHTGAEKINVIDAQTFSPPKPINNVSDDSDSDKKKKPRTYKKFEITEPANEGTVRNNQGYVVINVLLEPDLTPGDKLQLLFDGSAIGEPQPNLTFKLSGVYRGAHNIAVQVLNPKGDVLKTTETITFFMHRARVGMGGGGARN